MEINEAFAVMPLAWLKATGADPVRHALASLNFRSFGYKGLAARDMIKGLPWLQAPGNSQHKSKTCGQ